MTRFELIPHDALSEGFRTGEHSRPFPVKQLAELSGYAPEAACFVSIHKDISARFAKDRAAADAETAMRVFREMSSVPRTVAVQGGFWHALVLSRAQQLVRWRWMDLRTQVVPSDRLLSRHASPWRNGLGRLWWVAAVVGGSESRVRTICSLQQAIDSVADQRVAANPSFVEALELRIASGAWGSDEVKGACRIANQIARTHLLDSFSPSELAEAIDAVRDEENKRSKMEGK
jgi:hypothetical protein